MNKILQLIKNILNKNKKISGFLVIIYQYKRKYNSLMENIFVMT